MRERSAEEQPPKLKTYSLEMTLIKLFRNYTMYSSCSLFRPLAISPAMFRGAGTLAEIACGIAVKLSEITPARANQHRKEAEGEIDGRFVTQW